MNTLIWTNHVLERLKGRRISKDSISNTINNPDQVIDNPDGSKEFRKHIGIQDYTAVVKKGNPGEWVIVSAWVRPPNPGTADFKKNMRYKNMQEASNLKKIWLTLLNQLGL